MPDLNRFFNAKILLFGEHIVNAGGNALAMPFNRLGGQFKAINSSDVTPSSDAITQSQKSLTQLIPYLQKERLALRIDQFVQDLEQGLYFDSNIPQGFGLGSSGALVAAIYHKYAPHPILPKTAQQHPEKLANLQQHLAQIESAFHGKSSGTDPLISYLNQAVLIVSNKENGKKLQVIKPYATTFQNIRFFLLDTQQPRQTAPWVNRFLAQFQTSHFQHLCTNELVSYSNNCITAFLKQDAAQLQQHFKQLSAFHCQHLPDFMGKIFLPFVKNGLETNGYYLKICGAGGGGFLLGITTESYLPQLKTAFAPYEIVVI
ncbi:MAG: mevalonate kinase family protein [Chitinophagales bacterium]